MSTSDDTFSSGYDLATLQECMNKGWRHVAALAKGLHEFAGLGEQWLGWEKHGRKKILCRVAEELFRDVLECDFRLRVKSVVHDSGNPLDPRHDIELPIWRALAEVVVTGRTRDAMADFCSARWPRSMPERFYPREWADPQWNPHAIPFFELLLRAFDEPSHLEELYWRVVDYTYLEERVSELDALDKKLQSGDCFTSGDQEVINGYTTYGSLTFRRCEEDGSFTVTRHHELDLEDYPGMAYDGVAIARRSYQYGERWLKSWSQAVHATLWRISVLPDGPDQCRRGSTRGSGPTRNGILTQFHFSSCSYVRSMNRHTLKSCIGEWWITHIWKNASLNWMLSIRSCRAVTALRAGTKR